MHTNIINNKKYIGITHQKPERRWKNGKGYHNGQTEEQRENLSQKQKKNPIYKDENNPNAKRIMCVETGEIFNCIKYAKEKYHINSDGSLTIALKNQNRMAAGLYWKYL